MVPVRPALPRGAYLIAGLGRAGSAAAEALVDCPAAARVLAWDALATGPLRGVGERLRRRGVDVALGGDGLPSLASAGPEVTVVKSPGMDFDIPLLDQAQRQGALIIDELELGWRLLHKPLVGVTGTNGKSTTSKLIAAVLEAGGHSAELVGNTEFGPPLCGAGAGEWTVCEVSSFQLEGSPAFLPEIAVFTNLTPEHLTRHGTMEEYGAAKRRMFLRPSGFAECSIIGIDDEFGRRLATDAVAAGARVLSYGFAEEAQVRIVEADWDMRRAQIRVRTPRATIDCETRLPGAHNARNLAAAVAVGEALDVGVEQICERLQREEAPAGRWEVMTDSEPFDVLVDYAHTPDGIRQLLQTVRHAIKDRESARVRTVFGAVGLRDSEKASQSARLARALSDQLILTTGSAPRDPRIVRLEELRVAAAVEGGTEVVIERRAAIEYAIAAARDGDVVAVLGLGALTRQTVDARGTKIANDDRQIVREALAAQGSRSWS